MDKAQHTRAKNEKPSARTARQVKPAVANITFGKVTVEVRTPTPTEMKKRMTESRTVVTRLGKAITKPGVKVPMKKSTPIYTVDADNPRLVVQIINGKKTRGRFLNNGVFQEVAA